MDDYKFTSFSKNIIFWDTEFNGNDPYTSELLSIGMVDVSGKELYIELEYDFQINPWVRENILPFFTGEKIARSEVLSNIEKFVGDSKQHLVSFISPFDYVYLTKLLGREDVNRLFHWPPLDFGSILWGNGIDPEAYYTKNANNFFEQIGVDVSKYNQHNALDDAKLLREVYLKMIEKHV